MFNGSSGMTGGAVGVLPLPFAYLRPSFLYPEASVYQLAIGVIHLFNHGRLTMKFVREGCDMLGECVVVLDINLLRRTECGLFTVDVDKAGRHGVSRLTWSLIGQPCNDRQELVRTSHVLADPPTPKTVHPRKEQH